MGRSAQKCVKALLAMVVLMAIGAPGVQGAPGAASAQPQARVTYFYPTGEKATSVIALEKFSPSPVWLNKDYEYQLRVTNRGGPQILDSRFA